MPRLNSHAAFAQKRSLPAYLPGKQFVVVVEHCRIGLPGVGVEGGGWSLSLWWHGGGGKERIPCPAMSHVVHTTSTKCQYHAAASKQK